MDAKFEFEDLAMLINHNSPAAAAASINNNGNNFTSCAMEMQQEQRAMLMNFNENNNNANNLILPIGTSSDQEQQEQEEEEKEENRNAISAAAAAAAAAAVASVPISFGLEDEEGGIVPNNNNNISPIFSESKKMEHMNEWIMPTTSKDFNFDSLLDNFNNSNTNNNNNNNDNLNLDNLTFDFGCDNNNFYVHTPENNNMSKTNQKKTAKALREKYHNVHARVNGIRNKSTRNNNNRPLAQPVVTLDDKLDACDEEDLKGWPRHVVNMTCTELNRYLKNNHYSDEQKLELKQLRRRMKNRVYASTARFKRKVTQQELKSTFSEISQTKAQLEEEVRHLRSGVQHYKTVCDSLMAQLDKHGIKVQPELMEYHNLFSNRLSETNNDVGASAAYANESINE